MGLGHLVGALSLALDPVCQSHMLSLATFGQRTRSLDLCESTDKTGR